MANLSDLAAAPEPGPPSWIGTLSASRGFVPGPGLHARLVETPPSGQGAEEAATIVEAAFQDGFAAGEAAAAARFENENAIAQTLGSALARLDEASERAVRLRLAQTVASLCEQIIEPHLIDAEALDRRCQEALRWTEGETRNLKLRLHPGDIAMLPEATRGAWTIQPDPSLSRGTLQLETSDGVVRDGPDEWRRAIAAALAP